MKTSTKKKMDLVKKTEWAKKIQWVKAEAIYESVEEFPLCGAIANYKCSCGLTGGQPMQGTPDKFQHLVGKKFTHSCFKKAHEKVKSA